MYKFIIEYGKKYKELRKFPGLSTLRKYTTSMKGNI